VAVVEMVNVMMRVTDRQGSVSVIDRESACQRGRFCAAAAGVESGRVRDGATRRRAPIR
jgi:hypothetical protein